MAARDQRTAARPVPGVAGLAVMVVEAAGITFAVPAQAVAHVTVPLPVTPLPLVPGYVDGLIGLGGAILPQIDLRRRLALPAAPAGEAGEVLVVMADEGGYALRVDRVVTLTAVAPDSIQVFEADPAAGGVRGLAPGLVAGEFPWRQGRTVLLLHPDRLGLHEVVARGGGSGERPARAGGAVAVAPPPPAEPHHVYVVARSGSGCFALPVEHVAEVIAAGPVTPVPGAPPEVVGLVQLRGRPLPVLAPTGFAGAGGAGAGVLPGVLPGVLMVLDAACGRFALRVDAVIGVRRFPVSRIHAGAEAGGIGEGRAGYVVDGDRVIGLLDIDRLAAGGGGWRPLLPPVPVPAADEGTATRQILLFRVGPEWCGLDVVRVVRLTSYRPTVPLPVPSPVPATEPLAELAGVVEIDAEVLPALDLRVMMAMPAAVDDWTAMIVVAGPDGRWALAVDRIDRLVVVPEAALRPAGAAVHPLVSHIVRVGDRLVSLLDLAPLFRV